MRQKAMFPAVAVALVLAGTATHALAQQTVARSYSFVPKDGMSAQFEAAMKAHLQWRADNGDPWTWGVSTIEVGDGMGEYSLRSGGHTYADLDTYDAQFGRDALTHYRATVAPLVESVSSSISTVDESLSHRPPEGRPLQFVQITTFHIRPDRQAQFGEAVAKVTQVLKDGGWGGYWVWVNPLAGGGMGPSAQVVGLHDSWADMQEPDPPMMAVLAQAMGQDDFEAWLESFGQSIRGQETIVRRLRPDMNPPGN